MRRFNALFFKDIFHKRRFNALLRKEFIHMRRDPRTLMMIFIMPILQLVLMGYATNTDVKNVPTVVFDQSNSQESRSLLDAYRSTGYFSIDYVATSDADVNGMIEGGNAKVGIVIPPTYNSDLSAGKTAVVAVIIDGSDPTVASAALSAATLVGQTQGVKIQLEKLARTAAGSMGSASPLEVRTRVLYNPDMQSSYNLIPALIAMILMTTTTNMTSFAIVKERERGTMEQLIVTPIRNTELMIAKIVPYVAVSLADVVLILMLGTLMFHVPIRGSILLLFTLTGLFLLPNLGLGLLISTYANTQQQAQMMNMPIMLPSMMLSGFIFPVASLPIFLQFISHLLPLYYFIIIARSIVVKGAGLEYLIPQTVALIIFSIILVGLAVRRFRKSLD